jgi:predicted metal-dependent hydrolase
MKNTKKLQLELRAIHETWQIVHEKSSQTRTTIKKIAPYQLLIKGPSTNRSRAIENWLKKKANRHIGQWLQAISEDINIPFAKLCIRGQKARWGSCSENKDINLNYKLLFLPAYLVEHVLIHELCHTKELNHSKKFWQLMSNHNKNYRKYRKLLHQANQYLPQWL